MIQQWVCEHWPLIVAGAFAYVLIATAVYACLIVGRDADDRLDEMERRKAADAYWDWIEMVYGEETLVYRPMDGDNNDVK